MLRERKKAINYTADRELQADLLAGGWKASGEVYESAREYRRGTQSLRLRVLKTQGELDVARKLLRNLDARMTGCDRVLRTVDNLPLKAAPLDAGISKWIGAHDRKKESGQ